MKIARIKAINFKGIKHIDVLLKKNVNRIVGPNGAGKSSLKDSIMATLCGAKYTPDIPVRVGQGKADITVDMGDYIVHGIYTKSGRRIEVETADGAPVKRPQELLDACIGPLTFDPVVFFSAKPSEQVAMLKELVQVDFADLNAQQAVIKQRRSDAKREKERLLYEAKRIPVVEDLPDEEISMTALTTDLQRANNFNQHVESNIRASNTLKEKHSNIRAEIEDAAQQIRELQANIRIKEQNLKTIDEAINCALLKIKDKQDTTTILDKIAHVEVINKDIQEKQRRERLKAAAEAQSTTFSELGQQAKAVEAERAERLAKCKMPVEGLSLTDEYVTFGEFPLRRLPLKQVNTGKQLEICVSIAMAMNPNLKTVFVKANDLDQNSLELLEKMIIEKGYQALIEIADADAKIGIVIEDGRIKEKE